MKTKLYDPEIGPELLEAERPVQNTELFNRAFDELERRVIAVLETYSNVHRGTGHYSLITTELYEQARDIILDYLELDKAEYTVIFCTPRQSELLIVRIKPENYQIISSKEIGLSLGLRALAVKKNALPKGVPFQTGGSVVKIVSNKSVIWADAPQKFEAGTPCVLNAIAFAIALRIVQEIGTDCFKQNGDTTMPVTDILQMDSLSEFSGTQLLAKLRKQLIGYNLQVPTAEGEKPFVNLDNAASTPTFYPVWNAVKKVCRQPEKAQADVIRDVKNILSDFLGADKEKYDIIFTCNTTEALNITSRFIQNEFNNDDELIILNTLLEHNSNELPWRYIPGASLVRIPVNKEGFINLYELELILRAYNQECLFGNKRIRMVAVSGCSNVLGTVNDIKAISRITHKYNARILVDAAQLVAHRTVKIDEWGIDYLAFSGHKVYAPFGSGALIIRKDLIHAQHFELEKIKTSGEENVIGIAALGKAISLLQRIGMDVMEKWEKELVFRLLRGLSGIKGIEIFGIANPDSKRLAQKGAVVSFCFNNVPHNLAAKQLAEQGGIGVRNGCFCAHLLVKHLLNIHPVRALALNIGVILLPRLTSAFLPGLVRVSFGLENNFNDIDRLIEILEKIVNEPSSGINRLLALNRNGTAFFPHIVTKQKMQEFFEVHIQRVYSFNNRQVNN
jgi:selenocysteine lyase/cysteine desulfurase